MNGFYSAILMRAHTRTLVSQLSCDIFIHSYMMMMVHVRRFDVISYLRLGRQQQSAIKLVMEMRFVADARHTHFRA